MSDTVVNDPSNANLVEDDQPRLGAPHPMLNQAPQGSVFDTAPTAAALPVVSPVLTDGSNPAIQSPPVARRHDRDRARFGGTEPAHPAHAARTRAPDR